MDSYTKLALDWLTGHPMPEAVTTNPTVWAASTGSAIRQRIRDLVDQLAPPLRGDDFQGRVNRLNSAEATAREMAIEEHLPNYESPEVQQGWVPLVPEISDLL